MKTPLPSLAALLCLALFPACAKKKQDPKPAPAPQPIVQPTLAPEYATACRSLAPNSSQIDYLQTNGTRLRLATRSFEGNGCDATRQTSILEIFHNYKLGAAKKDRILELDLQEREIKFTPMSQLVADSWNRIAFCGVTGWKPNEYQLIDKRSGCMGERNTVNQRAIYTLIDLQDDRIQLGRETGTADDGSEPAKRHNALDPTVYGRTGSSVLLPPEDNSCPRLIGSYACTQGDSFFAGKNAAVTEITDINRITSIRFDLTQTGTQPYSETYLPGQPERVLRGGGMVITMMDSCQLGRMISKSVSYREGDTRNKDITERQFRTDSRRSLIIETRSTRVVNDRPDRTENQLTECVRVN